MFIIFSLQNLFFSFQVALRSPFLHLTHYICTNTLHKNTIYSQAQAQAHHIVKVFKTNAGFSPRLRYLFAGFSNLLQGISKIALYFWEDQLCSFRYFSNNSSNSVWVDKTHYLIISKNEGQRKQMSFVPLYKSFRFSFRT